MKADTLKDEKDLSVNNNIEILLKESHGQVDIEHGGTDQGDYIWHFMPARKSRLSFPQDLGPVYQIIVTHLKNIIPEEILVQVYPPEKAWEVKLITVAARKLKKHWTFDQDQMKKYLPIIGNSISSVMVRTR